MAVLGVVAGDEVVQTCALQLVFFQREVLIGSEVVDSKFFCPGFFLAWFAVEEKNIGFNALRVEDACRQTKMRVNIRLLEQLAPDRLPRSASEDRVVRHDDGGTATLFEDRKDLG